MNARGQLSCNVIATCDNHLVHCIRESATRKIHQRISIQHASHIFIPISCILYQVLTHFRCKRLRSLLCVCVWYVCVVCVCVCVCVWCVRFRNTLFVCVSSTMAKVSKIKGFALLLWSTVYSCDHSNKLQVPLSLAARFLHTSHSLIRRVLRLQYEFCLLQPTNATEPWQRDLEGGIYKSWILDWTCGLEYGLSFGLSFGLNVARCK